MWQYPLLLFKVTDIQGGMLKSLGPYKEMQSILVKNSLRFSLDKTDNLPGENRCLFQKVTKIAKEFT